MEFLSKNIFLLFVADFFNINASWKYCENVRKFEQNELVESPPHREVTIADRKVERSNPTSYLNPIIFTVIRPLPLTGGGQVSAAGESMYTSTG